MTTTKVLSAGCGLGTLALGIRALVVNTTAAWETVGNAGLIWLGVVLLGEILRRIAPK